MRVLSLVTKLGKSAGLFSLLTEGGPVLLEHLIVHRPLRAASLGAGHSGSAAVSGGAGGGAPRRLSERRADGGCCAEAPTCPSIRGWRPVATRWARLGWECLLE